MNIEGNLSQPFLRSAWLEALEIAFEISRIDVETPKCKASFQISGDTLYFSGRASWLSDYAVIAGDGSDLLKVIQLALQKTPRAASVSRIVLDAFEESQLQSVSGSLPGWYRVDRFHAWAPEIVFKDPSILSGIVKKDSFKRASKKLEKGGHRVELQVFSDLKSRFEVLDEFVGQHSKRSIEKHGYTEFQDDRYKVFLRELLKRDLEQPDDSCRVHFSALSIDGRRVAFHMGFATKSRFFWYKPSLSTEKTVINAPGEYLMVSLIQEFCKQGARVFDFTIGDEGYKYRFSNHNKALYEMRLYRSFLRALGWRVRQWVKTVWNRVVSRR